MYKQILNCGEEEFPNKPGRNVFVSWKKSSSFLQTIDVLWTSHCRMRTGRLVQICVLTCKTAMEFAKETVKISKNAKQINLFTGIIY